MQAKRMMTGTRKSHGPAVSNALIKTATTIATATQMPMMMLTNGGGESLLLSQPNIGHLPRLWNCRSRADALKVQVGCCAQKMRLQVERLVLGSHGVEDVITNAPQSDR